MKRSSVTVVLVVAAFVLAVVVAAVYYWQHSTAAAYEAEVQAEWSDLSGKLATLDSTVATKSSDFADIRKSADDLKSRVDQAKNKFQQARLPWGYSSTFHSNLLAYLDQAAKTLALLSNNCVVWSGTELAEFERGALECRNLCQNCVNSWPGRRALSYKPDLFVQVPATFNAMRKERKKATSGSGTAVVLLPGMTTGVSSSFVMPTDPYLASYVSQMQSLLREYKGLRGSLDRFIAYVRKYGTPPPGSDICSALESAKSSRMSILNRMQSISPPSGWENNHSQAVQCLQNGIDAIVALQNGDYQTFHNISQTNTSMLARIRSVYGY